MARLFDTGIFSVNATNGSVGVGYKLYFYTTGTSTPKATYPTRADAAAATNANANPVVSQSDGRWNPIWLTSGDYKVILKDADDVTLETRDPADSDQDGQFAVSTYMTTLLDDTTAAAARTTLGLGTTNLGSLPSGSTDVIDIATTATSGHAGGTSQLYTLVNRVYAQGSNNYDYVRANYSGTHVDTTGGTTTNADGLHQYVWLSGSGNVTYAQAVAGHIRVDGPGDITGEASVFRAVSTTLGATGAIEVVKGFSAGQLGDATKVVNVYQFDAEDTQSSNVVIGYRSQISANGPYKYAFFGSGTAPSAFGGSVAIGMTSLPSWKLHVQETSSTHIAAFDNTNASSPAGIRVRYTGGAPNDSDHAFLTCSDTVGNKILVYSNGNVANLNNSYGAISDRKLKTAIRDAGPQLADIKEIRFRKYKLKSDGKDAKEHLGVVAQELEKVSPGLVSTDGEGTKSVNYSILYLKAVKALQELATIVEAQGEQLRELTARQKNP